MNILKFSFVLFRLTFSVSACDGESNGVILNIVMHFVEFSSNFNQVVFFSWKNLSKSYEKKKSPKLLSERSNYAKKFSVSIFEHQNVVIYAGRSYEYYQRNESKEISSYFLFAKKDFVEKEHTKAFNADKVVWISLFTNHFFSNIKNIIVYFLPF